MSQLQPEEPKRQSKLRLGLFGATRSGKTVYLTTLYWLSKNGQLPEGVSGLLPADRESAQYLGERYAMIEAGKWPPGNLESQQVALDIGFKSKVITLTTNDFRGGDFTTAFYGTDPSNQDRAEEFVRKLFKGCSAYIFLVDADEIRASVENRTDTERQKTVASRLGAIETTLNVLRRKAWGIWRLHPPVAVVITKSDLHPECLADPQAYAKRHLRPTWDYLHQHARSNHSFFAITSTGVVPPGLEGPPLPLQPSENFVEPILWCVEKNKTLLRLRRSSVAAVCFAGLFAIWIALFFIDHHRLAEVEKEIPQVQEGQLQQLYTQVQDWQGWTLFTLTHPGSITRLGQVIVGEAETRLNNSLANRKDASGNLRTVDDYEVADKQIKVFVERYPGTENAVRLTSWIAAQRQHLGEQSVKRLYDAAEEANERHFDDLFREYGRVASPTLDPEVDKARDTLDKRIVADQVKMLWYKWKIEPQDVDDIREKCQAAEETLRNKKYQKEHQEFVQLVRNTYDQLKQSRTVKISFHLESQRGRKVKWWFEIDGIDVATSDGWRDPVPLAGDRSKIEGASAKIDLLKTKYVRAAFRIDDRWTPFGTNSGLTTPLYSLEQLSFQLKEPVDVATDRNEKYQVFFQADNQLVDYCRAMARIKELGNELFGSAKAK